MGKTSSWLAKVNFDGVARGHPGPTASCGVFRMYNGFLKGGFVMPSGVKMTIHAKLMGFIMWVKLTKLKG